MTETPWWDPARHADRRPLLAARGRIQRAFRGWLEAGGGGLALPLRIDARRGDAGVRLVVDDWGGTGP